MTQRRNCPPPPFKRASGWFVVGSFSFWYRTGEAIDRKRHAEYDVPLNMIKMWANAPGPVGSSHPREERTSRKKVSGQGRVPGVIKINFLAFFAVFLCIFICIWSILGIFLTGILRQALQAEKARLQRMLRTGESNFDFICVLQSFSYVGWSGILFFVFIFYIAPVTETVGKGGISFFSNYKS